ncbi:hypothetical protein BS47DRAFT_1370104, partial [Hydnum rufescens UP504]
LDPPSYTPAMNVQNNGVKMILPYYQSLFTKFFSSCHCALEHWSSVARYLKVLDVPLPPMKPTSLGCSTSLEFIPDSVWASGDVHLNVLTRFAYNCRGYTEYVMHLAINHIARTYNLDLPVFGIDDRQVGAVYRLPLTPVDCQAVDDLVRMGTPVFGVVEYPHRDRRDTVPDRCPDSPEAAAAAAAEYFAAMKNTRSIGSSGRIWDILVNLIAMIVLSVKLHRAFCLLAKFARLMWSLYGLPWSWPVACCPGIQGAKVLLQIRIREAIKIYVNEDDGPMASSSKAVGDNMEDHGFNIYDDIMGNPYDEDDDNWENEGDYDLNPTPHLDAKQEAEAKALVLAAKVEMVLQSLKLLKFFKVPRGRRGGNGTTGSLPKLTSRLQLCNCGDPPMALKGEKKAGEKTCPGETACRGRHSGSPRIRALEEAQRLEAERLKREAEEHFLPPFLPLWFPAPPVPALPVPSAPASVPNPAQPRTPTPTPTSLEPGSPHAPTYSPVTP